MFEFFKARITEAQTLDELDYIVEQASMQLESDDEYKTLYNLALAKAKEWSPL